MDWQQGKTPQLVLTDADRLAIKKRASTGIMRTLVAQAVMLVAAVAGSWIVAGGYAALSALLGGLAYLLPNSLFALRLLLGVIGPVSTSPITFFVGEAFKLGSAVGILGLAVWLGQGWLVWPAMLIGLLCVLKGYVLLLVFRKLP